MRLRSVVGLAMTFVAAVVPLQTCDAPPAAAPAPGACIPSSETSQSLIPNGDFNQAYESPSNPGYPGQALTASAPYPWIANRTPDYSSPVQIAFHEYFLEREYLPGFNTSPSGGSFMGFRTLGDRDPTGEEGIYNTLTITNPNDQITIAFDYTEYTYVEGSPYPLVVPPVDPFVKVQFRLDINPGMPDVSSTGVLIGDIPNLWQTGGTPGTWQERRITFTPANLGYTQPGNYYFYLGAGDSVEFTWAFVDGLFVNVTRQVCPPGPTPTPPAPTPPPPPAPLPPTPPTSAPT